MNKDSIMYEPDFRQAVLKHGRKLYPRFSMSGSNWESVSRVVMNELQKAHEENRRFELDRIDREYSEKLGTQLWLGKLALCGMAVWMLGLTIYMIVKV